MKRCPWHWTTQDGVQFSCESIANHLAGKISGMHWRGSPPDRVIWYEEDPMAWKENIMDNSFSNPKIPDNPNTHDVPDVETFLERMMEHRHPSVAEKLQFFHYSHLPEPLMNISQHCAVLALDMCNNLPDTPQLSLGLQKLLEAKDCFVRTGITALNDSRKI